MITSDTEQTDGKYKGSLSYEAIVAVLPSLIRKVARFPYRVPELNADTPLNGDKAYLTFLEKAELLVRLEERFNIHLNTANVSKDWFISLNELAKSVAEHGRNHAIEIENHNM
jgi:hypothetical protein